jgi:hypothetical protein
MCLANYGASTVFFAFAFYDCKRCHYDPKKLFLKIINMGKKRRILCWFQIRWCRLSEMPLIKVKNKKPRKNAQKRKLPILIIFKEKNFWVIIALFSILKCKCEKTLHFQTLCKSKKLFFANIYLFSIWFPLSLKHWSPLVYIYYITADWNSISSQLGSFCQGDRYSIRERQAVRNVHHVQTCRYHLLQPPSRRATVLGQPFSLRPHYSLPLHHRDSRIDILKCIKL